MKIFYRVPFLTTNGKINLLITQGRTEKGFVRIASFTSRSGYIFWNVVVQDQERKLFAFKDVGLALKKAIAVVRDKSVHSTSSVELLEVMG